MTQIAALSVPAPVLLSPSNLDAVAAQYNAEAQGPQALDSAGNVPVLKSVTDAQKKYQRDSVVMLLVIVAVGVVLASRGHLK